MPGLKNFIVDALFPKFCLNCGKEGEHLCEDCFSLIEILERQYCPFCPSAKITLEGRTCSVCKRNKNLSGLYCAASYDNFIVKKLVHQFKYEPYIKDIATILANLIINHLANLNKLDGFESFFLVPVPLHKKKMKRRGFNQAEEMAKILSPVLKMPVLKDALLKIKATAAQIELEKEGREKNIQGAFVCPDPKLVENKRIVLVDDIFTTGSTMEECARILRDADAKEVWGMVAARG